MTDDWWEDNNSSLLKLDTLDIKFDMEFVHDRDVDFVRWLASCVDDRKDPGPWIAGGACLRWYQRQPATTDIDIFFNNKYQWAQFKDRLVAKLGDVYDVFLNRDGKLISAPFQSSNAWTFEIKFQGNKTYKVQLILKKFFKSAQAVIDRFDISVCQIAIDLSDTQGPVTVGEYFARDVAAKQFRINDITDSTVSRVFKYICYGYEPVAEVKDKILASDSKTWNIPGDYHAF